MKPGEAKACEACGCPMIFALTRDGKVAPIERDPSPTGNVLLFRAPINAALAHSFGIRDEEPVTQCRTFGDGMGLLELRDQGVPLRLNHFAYCPKREQFARRRS